MGWRISGGLCATVLGAAVGCSSGPAPANPSPGGPPPTASVAAAARPSPRLSIYDPDLRVERERYHSGKEQGDGWIAWFHERRAIAHWDETGVLARTMAGRGCTTEDVGDVCP